MNKLFAFIALTIMVSPLMAWDGLGCFMDTPSMYLTNGNMDGKHEGIDVWNLDGSKNIYLVDSIHLNTDTCLIVYMPSDDIYYLFVEYPINLRKVRSYDFLMLDDIYILDKDVWKIIPDSNIFRNLQQICVPTKKEHRIPTPLMEIKGRDKKWYLSRYIEKPDYYYLFLIQSDLYNQLRSNEYKNKKIKFKSSKAYYRILLPVWK